MNSVSPLGSGMALSLSQGKTGKTMVLVLIIDRPKIEQRTQAVYMLQRDAIDHNNKLPEAEAY